MTVLHVKIFSKRNLKIVHFLKGIAYGLQILER